MTTVEIKYLTQPHDGTPGTPWDDFEERILSVAAGKTDDRGWSLADTLNGVDEGGAGGPPVPGGAAGTKAAAARHIFTKALDKGTFIKFRDVMMNNNTPLREALSAAADTLHGEASRLAQRLVRQPAVCDRT